MMWAKTRAPARYDLAMSNLLGCTFDDLPGALDTVSLNGLNPDGYPPLIEAIAQKYGVSSDMVATGTGAAGANFLVMAALVRPGDEVLVERPAYDPLLGALRVLGARINRFDRIYEDDWAVDPERVAGAITAATRLIVVSSPHNPTGAVINTAVLQEMREIARSCRARVLVDEVYLDAVYEDRPPPAATLGPELISTNSLTKSWGLAGLRSGWALAAPGVAESIRRTRDVVDGNGVFAADQLALIAFQHMPALEARARRILQPNLERLSTTIAARPDLEWVRPGGGTVGFVRLPATADTRIFAQQLHREYDTAVVPGFFFEAPAFVRIAFGCSAETLEGGLNGLEAALDAQTAAVPDDRV
jgi:aspartate/methionine/tyrosine aminotransferase